MISYAVIQQLEAEIGDLRAKRATENARLRELLRQCIDVMDPAATVLERQQPQSVLAHNLWDMEKKIHKELWSDK